MWQSAGGQLLCKAACAACTDVISARAADGSIELELFARKLRVRHVTCLGPLRGGSEFRSALAEAIDPQARLPPLWPLSLAVIFGRYPSAVDRQWRGA